MHETVERLVDLLELDVRQQLSQRDDQRRVTDQPRSAVDHLDQLVERLEAVLPAGLRQVSSEAPDVARLHLGRHQGLEILLVQARVPDVQLLHQSQVLHRLAIGPADGDVDPVALLGVEATVPTRNGKACDQALDVPLERAGQGLVEVVEAEHEPPVRSGVHAEVRQVRVPAELHGQVRARGAGEVRRHQVGGASVERERRREHARVPKGDQLRHPRHCLFLQQGHGVRPVGRRLPLAVTGAWNSPTDRLPARRPRFPGEGIRTAWMSRQASRAACGRFADRALARRHPPMARPRRHFAHHPVDVR